MFLATEEPPPTLFLNARLVRKLTNRINSLISITSKHGRQINSTSRYGQPGMHCLLLQHGVDLTRPSIHFLQQAENLCNSIGKKLELLFLKATTYRLVSLRRPPTELCAQQIRRLWQIRVSNTSAKQYSTPSRRLRTTFLDPHHPVRQRHRPPHRVPAQRRKFPGTPSSKFTDARRRQPARVGEIGECCQARRRDAREDPDSS